MRTMSHTPHTASIILATRVSSLPLSLASQLQVQRLADTPPSRTSIDHSGKRGTKRDSMAGRPRSSSMTDAFRIRPEFRAIPREDNPILSYVARAQATHEKNADFINNLPRLTERDLATLELSDSSCPICIVPFLSILSEEEIAGAMDSPAYSVEQLGVTRLHQTCGHVFCRKELSIIPSFHDKPRSHCIAPNLTRDFDLSSIQNWLLAGHNSCPTCRHPLVTPEPSEDLSQAPDVPRARVLGTEEADSDAFIQEMQGLSMLEAMMRPAHRPIRRGRDDNSHSAGDSRSDFSGMYS